MPLPNQDSMSTNQSAIPRLPLSANHRRLPSTTTDPDRIIRQMGLKVTQPRLALIRAIQSVKAHLTAQELFDMVRTSYPDIGFATVYRFLRTLSEWGYLTEVRLGLAPARYEWADKKHHDHLTCTSCGLICEFENDQIESLQVQVASQLGFKLTGHVLELFGLCRRCQKMVNSSRSQGT